MVLVFMLLLIQILFVEKRVSDDKMIEEVAVNAGIHCGARE